MNKIRFIQTDMCALERHFDYYQGLLEPTA